jgi:hypothetical protein
MLQAKSEATGETPHVVYAVTQPKRGANPDRAHKHARGADPTGFVALQFRNGWG